MWNSWGKPNNPITQIKNTSCLCSFSRYRQFCHPVGNFQGCFLDCWNLWMLDLWNLCRYPFLSRDFISLPFMVKTLYKFISFHIPLKLPRCSTWKLGEGLKSSLQNVPVRRKSMKIPKRAPNWWIFWVGFLGFLEGKWNWSSSFSST